MTDSDERAEKWLPVEPMDGCTFSAYEASDKGALHSLDRQSGSRFVRGVTFKLKPSPDGYVRVGLRCDNPGHKAHTFTMQKVVLTTFDRACPPGMEACHSRRGPAFNWWPEGVRWGTKPENHADQVAAGTAVVPDPAFPCRNAPACANMVHKEGRRCPGCVRQMGVDAAAMLNAGTPLEQVAATFGNGADWVFRLAVEHGGYEGTREQARAVHRPCQCPDCQPPADTQRECGWFARTVTTLRARRRGDGA
jgi:hypothetical protein